MPAKARKSSRVAPAYAAAARPSLAARPQRDVPGFEGALTCAADWPRERTPATQSAVFNPLLACALGAPVDGLCTAEDLRFAAEWWARAMPAWPRWVTALRAAGLQQRRARLLKSASGSNALVFRAHGCGLAPHFAARAQNQALELDAQVAVEVYAAVACLYSPLGDGERVVPPAPDGGAAPADAAARATAGPRDAGAAPRATSGEDDGAVEKRHDALDPPEAPREPPDVSPADVALPTICEASAAPDDSSAPIRHP